VFVRALKFRLNPAIVRRYSDEVLAVATLMNADPAEVGGWDERDRRWLLVTSEAQRLAGGA